MPLKRVLNLGLLSVALACLCACNTDALYSYCDAPSQCGQRVYGEDENEVTVYLDCVEVQVDVREDVSTEGQFCTLPCDRRRDCDSQVGLADGECIQWEGDEEAFCYQRCGDDTPCYPSSVCEVVSIDGVETSVCLPTRS